MTKNPPASPPERRGVPVWVQILIWAGLTGLLVVLALGLLRSMKGTVQVGDPIPDFSMTLYDDYAYDGRTLIDLSDLRGKVVMINFWASWCKPCEQEAAELQQAWERYQPGGEVVFLGVDYVDTETNARLYLRKYGITFPNGPDLGTRISQLFRMQGVPETYFLDREGILRNIQIGPFPSTRAITDIIDALLAR